MEAVEIEVCFIGFRVMDATEVMHEGLRDICWGIDFHLSPAVKAPILGEACIRVRIKYFYSFMTFGPY